MQSQHAPHFLPAALACFVVGAASTANAQGPCPFGTAGYSNLTTYSLMDNTLLEAGEANSREHGNEITLSGAAPVAKRFDFVLRISGTGVATVDFRVRFYANDGPGGVPGTLLWASDVRHVTLDSGSCLGYNVTAPDVALPQKFTFTLQATNRQGFNTARLGPCEYTPPAIGSATPGVWKRTGPGPSDWILTGLNEPPFGARLCIVSAPGDANCDGAANALDVAAFVQVLLDPSSYAQQHPGCDFHRADMNCDGVVDGLDVDPFVRCLVAANCSCS